MKLILLKILSLLFLSQAYGFQYEPENLRFTETSYRLYVRPQFQSILQDYRTLFKLISIDTPLAEEHNNLLIEIYKISYEINSSCTYKINIRACELLKKDLYELIKKILVHNESLSRNPPFTNLKKIQGINTLKAKTYQLEDFIISLNLATNNEMTIRKFTKLAEELAIYKEKFQEMNLNFLPIIFRQSFSLIEINFFIPVINNYISDSKYENLFTMTKDLNKSFNHFLMEMLKKGRPIPAKAKPLLEVMQRRWNSILKVVVKS